MGLGACGAESWTPPPPAGVTWQYDYQGFRERNTSVVAGTFGSPGFGMAYGGAFSFRNQSELHGHETADPFAESSPIDGIRFNEHLDGQGAALAPAASVAPSSLRAPVSPPLATSTPAPATPSW